ncbi:MAG: hypothetical protein R2750_11850 [Bacteroidales bacterium]
MKFNLRESLKFFFDYKIGLAGGLVMGIIIFIINYRWLAMLPGLSPQL